MTMEEAKKDMERFVSLKTSMRPAFVDVLLHAKETKHGHWVDGEYYDWLTVVSYAQCSVCGKKQNPEQVYLFQYCPHCGAMMDEEE